MNQTLDAAMHLAPYSERVRVALDDYLATGSPTDLFCLSAVLRDLQPTQAGVAA